MARAWIIDAEGEFVRDAAMESGFLRCPEPGKVELLLAHNTGFAEVWYGAADAGKLEVHTAGVGFTETAKEVDRGLADLRQRRGRPDVRLRHGRDGPGAPAPHLGASEASLTVPDELADRLRGSGYRLTPQRQLILRAVEDLGHATVDEVLARVRTQASAVNASTVYRTLEVLEELGLVRHTHLSDRAPTYHSAREPEHFHLVCRNCQRVQSVEPDVATALVDTLRRDHGFDVDLGPPGDLRARASEDVNQEST